MKKEKLEFAFKNGQAVIYTPMIGKSQAGTVERSKIFSRKYWFTSYDGRHTFQVEEKDLSL